MHVEESHCRYNPDDLLICTRLHILAGRACLSMSLLPLSFLLLLFLIAVFTAVLANLIFGFSVSFWLLSLLLCEFSQQGIG